MIVVCNYNYSSFNKTVLHTEIIFGFTRIYNKLMHKYTEHSRSILECTGIVAGSLAWCDEHLSTGSRDNTVLQWDQRLPAFPTRRLLGHVQEVCGLRWAPNHQHLASGGNDNKLFIWSNASSSPLHCLMEHKAAVKALAWSPHQVTIMCVLLYLGMFILG